MEEAKAWLISGFTVCVCGGAAKLIKCRLLLTNYTRREKRRRSGVLGYIKICSVLFCSVVVVGRFYRVAAAFVFTSEFQVRSTKSQPTADSNVAREQTNKNRAAAVAISHIVHTHTSKHITVNVNCVSI